MEKVIRLKQKRRFAKQRESSLQHPKPDKDILRLHAAK
jgi:hypothetical protein